MPTTTHNPFANVATDDLVAAPGQLTALGNRLVGKIDGWLVAHPGYHSRSTVAKGVKIDTTHAWIMLGHMERHGLAKGSGNGCWRKFAAY